MANVTYDNFFLTNEMEDQFNSHLDLMQFCTVDDSLTGTAGMVRKIHRYKATDGAEKLAMGAGNTKSIEASFTEEEYRIAMVQNRFEYYDEELMTDPYMVATGARHIATDLFNVANTDIYSEFNKTTVAVSAAALNFDAFVDGVAKLNLENIEGVSIFAFVNASDMADLRKNLGEDLKYVESFARSGYVGTVAGVNVYTKKDAVKGTIVLGVKGAVTWFNKKGMEAPVERVDENTRKNAMYGRKYYIVALTDETKAVKITVTP